MAKIESPGGWWPVDYAAVGYLTATGALTAAYSEALPHAAWLVAAHAAGILLVLAAIYAAPGAAASPRAFFRHWYPLAYVPVCYREMAMLIPPIRHTDLDAAMARLDHRIWGANPTVWLERVQAPWLTEILQIVYTLFVPAVLSIALILWVQRRYSDFRYYAFLVTIGFLTSYIGYFLVPVRGPRFFLSELHEAKLHGLWLFESMRHTLDRLESAHYDCFPSGHTELTLIAWWGSRLISKQLMAVFSVYSLAIIYATVYLRYHYTVDVLAGAVLAAVLLVAAPIFYEATLSRSVRDRARHGNAS